MKPVGGTRFPLRIFDVFFLIVSVGATVVAGLSALRGSSGGPPLVEVQAPEGIFFYPLDQNRDLYMRGPAGVTWIRIQDGRAFAVASPGPRKIMLQMGKISRRGEWIASVPNHVFVRIVGGPPPSVDATLF